MFNRIFGDKEVLKVVKELRELCYTNIKRDIWIKRCNTVIETERWNNISSKDKRKVYVGDNNNGDEADKDRKNKKQKQKQKKELTIITIKNYSKNRKINYFNGKQINGSNKISRVINYI